MNLSRLADDPALAVLEGNLGEAVVDLLVRVEVREGPERSAVRAPALGRPRGHGGLKIEGYEHYIATYPVNFQKIFQMSAMRRRT